MSLQHTIGDGWVPEDLLADYTRAKDLLAARLGVNAVDHSLSALVEMIAPQIRSQSEVNYAERLRLHGIKIT